MHKHNTLAWLHDQRNSCKGIADHVYPYNYVMYRGMYYTDDIENCYVINVMHLHSNMINAIIHLHGVIKLIQYTHL